jgi:hypothetical protein
MGQEPEFNEWRELLEVSGTSDLFPTVAEVDPYRIGVARSRYADDHQDPYVPREADAALNSMLGADLFVCVAGPPAAGKSRTAIEAARRVLPDAILLVPKIASGALTRLFGSDSPLLKDPIRRVVVWLDDLDRYVGPASFDLSLLEHLANFPAKVVVLGTIRDDRWRALLETTGEPVLNAARVVRLPARLADPELARARALYPAEDFTQWGIGERLVSAPLLERRYADAEEVAPVGWALVRAAIDWRRAGLVRPIPLSALSTLYRNYLERRLFEAASEAEFEEGLAWALEPLSDGSPGLLSQVGTGLGRAFLSSDYLFATTDERGEVIPDSVWQFLLDHVEPAELEGLAIAAFTRGNRSIAERAWERRLPGLRARARADLPTTDDALGFEPLVKGLRDLLNHRDTGFPLAIAVTAPWGGGKSSAMLQLRRLLDAPPEEAGASRRWYSVQFEAWKYEQSERLWAALAKAIYDQPQGQMTLGARIRFRLRLELERYREQRRYGLPASDEEREPRRVPRARLWWEWSVFLLKGVLPPAITLAIVAVAITKLPTGAHDLAWWLGGLASAATLVAAAGRNWGVVSDPFKRAIDRYVRRPDYAEQLGFTTEADKDIRCLTNVLTAEADRALAIFVDDLDRCTPKHVVEVIEAVNQIFNSSQDRRCVFFLGMDREVVATSIEVAYEDTVKRLKEQGSALADGYGMQFLSKIVQMTLSLPVPDKRRMQALLANVTGNAAPAPLPPPPTPNVQRLQERIEEQQPANPGDVERAKQQVRAAEGRAVSWQELEEAARRARAKLLGIEAPDVANAEFEVLQYLTPNPRQVKRFDNAFRLQLHLANSAGISGFGFRPGELIALGKWVALRLRWPDLAEAIDDEPELLAALERDMNGLASSEDEETQSRLKERYGRWFSEPDLRSVLQDANREQHIANLPEPMTLLRVA